MAKTGMERLRYASQQSKQENCSICVAAEVDNLCDAKCNDVRGIALRSIHKQIEAEHTAELKEARDARDIALRETLRRRELTEEARGVVERLRKIEPRDYDGCTTEAYSSSLNDFGRAICGALHVLSTKDVVLSMRDRLCELIEHGGKQYVDVAALRELASRMGCAADNPIYKGDGGEVEDYYTALLASDARAIRKAVEGAPKPDVDREAAADWVEDNGGLDAVRERMRLYTDMLNRIDSTVSGNKQTCFDSTTPMGEATDLFDAIFAELDKRLMPCDLTWPTWSDGLPITRDDAPEGVFSVCLGLNGECYALLKNIPLFGEDCLHLAASSETIERPEPEVLGADGLPIKVGETVYTIDGYSKVVAETNAGKCPDGSDEPWVRCTYGGWVRAATISHNPPDTQERMDEEIDECSLDDWCSAHPDGNVATMIHHYCARQRALDAKGGE